MYAHHKSLTSIVKGTLFDYHFLSPPIHLYLIFEISSLKNPVRRTGFFVYFELDFYCLCSLQKSSSKWGKSIVLYFRPTIFDSQPKNQVQQTRNFKLENVKNQVQIHRGTGQAKLWNPKLQGLHEG